MLKPVFDFIEKFITDFSLKRSLVVMAFILFITMSLFIFDSQTSTSQLSKYERSVKIIEKLESIEFKNEKAKIGSK